MISTVDSPFRCTSATCLFLPSLTSSRPCNNTSQRKACLPLRLENFSAKLFTPSNDRNAGSWCFRVSRSSGSGMLGSQDDWFSDDLVSKEGRVKLPISETEKLELDQELRKRKESNFGLQTDSVSNGETVSSSSPFVHMNRELDGKKTNSESGKGLGDDDVIQFQDAGIEGGTLTSKHADEKIDCKMGVRRGRQIMRRSNLFAKQVISIRSALSLGFISELWVDTDSVSEWTPALIISVASLST